MSGRKTATAVAQIGGLPEVRLRVDARRPPNLAGLYVVYWMTTARRTRWNFALQRAIGWAQELKRPLVVIEPLCCGGTWDTDRHHQFALQGMRDNAERLKDTAALYYPYVEPQPGDCRRLFHAVSQQACVVVTDEYPIVLPSIQSVETESPVHVERIDGNGLLPLRAADQAFSTAYAFRRFLQRNLPGHLLDAPLANPFAHVELQRLDSLPESLTHRWPAASPRVLSGGVAWLSRLPIDHRVPPALAVGGPSAARSCWKRFLAQRLSRYPDLRNHPDAAATSGLSPYLHFGHLSVHEIFHDLARHEGWSPGRLAEKTSGSREGWWGMSEPAEAFLDQLVTWRELGFNCCAHRADFDDFAALPPWSKATLTKHAGDHRPYTYSMEEFAAAETHDPLWNAAQRQLVAEGCIHNYLRMLWGKKILEWTTSPQEALDVMIELNNRYALDGQDPNSYSGIFWILGRYDRPWGPERPIFGTVRYMSSENTARKLHTSHYVRRYTAECPSEQPRGTP